MQFMQQISPIFKNTFVNAFHKTLYNSNSPQVIPSIVLTPPRQKPVFILSP